jgi:hypothetical protein
MIIEIFLSKFFNFGQQKILLFGQRLKESQVLVVQIGKLPSNLLVIYMVLKFETM